VKPVLRQRLIRPLTIIFALAVVFPLALLGLRSYAQNVTVNHSLPDLDPASWPNSSLTISNLGHAAVLMNYFGTRAIADPSLFSRVGMSIDSVITIGPKRHVDPPLARAGKLPNLTGIGSPYEPPEHAELVLAAGRQEPQVLAEKVLATLRQGGII